MIVKPGQIKQDGNGNIHIRFDNGRYVMIFIHDGAAKIIEEMGNTDIHNALMRPDLFVDKLVQVASANVG